MTLALKSIQDQAAGFYEQSPDEQVATLKFVLREAAQHPTEFRALVEQQKFDGLNCLPIIYQALATDLGQWAGFFLDEAERLLRLAKAATVPTLVLTHFKEFGFIAPAQFKHRQALLTHLTPELQNPNPAFRFHLMNTVEEMATASDVAAIQQLRALANDPDWRIRYNFYLLAKDSSVLGGPVSLNWLDYVRAKLLNSSSFA